eukprot:992059-Prorocentrum_minimum.AAC.2
MAHMRDEAKLQGTLATLPEGGGAALEKEPPPACPPAAPLTDTMMAQPANATLTHPQMLELLQVRQRGKL